MQNTLKEQLASGEFIVSVQIDPPRSGSRNSIFELFRKLDRLREAGVALVDINSSRKASHSSIRLAGAIRARGFEVIPHVTLRDSSLNGLRDQMLAAHALDEVTNFLVIRGDPFEKDQAPMPGVYETDTPTALRTFRSELVKEHGLDLVFGAAVNQNRKPLEEETTHTVAKELFGAKFFMSQPVFTEEQLQRLFSWYATVSKLPLLVGIWPLFDLGIARKIRNGDISGVVLPDEAYFACLAQKKEVSPLGAVERATRLVHTAKKNGARGVYLVAPSRDPLLLIELLKNI